MPKPEMQRVGDSYAICGDAFDWQTIGKVQALINPSRDLAQGAPLLICDPPYGGIVKEAWDVAQYRKWMGVCLMHAAPDSTIAMWGGIGKPLNRPFLGFAMSVEGEFPAWEIADWITWKKRRGYGKPRNYLFTREECLILRKGRPTFNVPLLTELRGYPGYNKAYPAKSEYLRRSNVWTDVNELFRGKLHPTQKPDALYRVLVETHSKPGDWVVDLCAGSGVTLRVCEATGRRACIVERDRGYLVRAGIFKA